jgi:mono/diheme cytochrome c family protein
MRGRWSARLTLAAGAAFVVAAAALYFTGRAGEGETDAGSTAQVASGARIYAVYCASCHGSNLEGQANWRVRGPDGKLPAPPHDASGHTWHHDDATLFGVTKLGLEAFVGSDYASDMPAFGDTLDDAEIRAVIDYIKSTWPDAVRERQELIDRQARESNS